MSCKPILIRSTPSPLDEFSITDVWRLNLHHNNTGNVAFPYGLIRNLMTRDRRVVSDWYGHRLPDPQIVNDEYSMYVLPMANDIGSHFAGEMKRLTDYISRLKIPVVVVGIGGAFSRDDRFDAPKPFDEIVKKFMNEVLKRSGSVGLRGEITGRYLKSLGYREGADYTVIGDPTLYNCGRTLEIRDFQLRSDSRIAYNMTPTAPLSSLRFLNRVAVQYAKSTYIAQDLGDLTKMYAGVIDPSLSIQRESVDEFPTKLDDFQFASGKSAMYFTAPSWIQSMRDDFDISIGTRIHGNILPTHAGLPTVTLAFGSRLTELVEFHNLPHVAAEDVDESWDVSDLLARVDLRSPCSVHTTNFDNYVSFLDSNQVPHCYRESAAGKELEFDIQYSRIDPMPSLRPLQTVASAPELLDRIAVGASIVGPKVLAQKQRMVRLAEEVKSLRAKMKEMDPSEQKGKISRIHSLLDSLG